MCSQKQLQGVVDRIWKAFPLESLKTCLPREASLRPSNRQEVLGDSEAIFIHHMKGDICNEYPATKLFAQLVLPKLAKAAESDEKEKIISIMFLFPLLTFIFVFRLFRRKEMLICLSGLRSLWGSGELMPPSDHSATM